MYPALKCHRMPDERFCYRKNVIATSIHPSTAALIMELSAPYLKENAQIMDPFCGVGTMLIERNQRVAAREMYATDIYGDAITFGRENARLAGTRIQFIHRDFFDFKHDYLFEEIITNMPVRGKKTKEEMERLYERFFSKALEITTREAVIIMYCNEAGFVKKQLRLHKELHLLQETAMQSKGDYSLFIIGVLR
jgi:23S rRNA G2445 N2-methylase RlmL